MKYSSLPLRHLLITLLAIAGICSPVRAESFAELMVKGDAADRTFNPAKALASYLPAEKMDSDNVPLLLRISRQYRHLMSDTGNEKKKLEYGRLALAYDMRLAKLAPRDSDAQLSLAITYGKMMPYLGKKEQVAASPVIKAAADKAIKLDSRNDNAWHVLGRWNQTLANVSGLKRTLGGMLYGDLPTGSYQESVKCFNKAIAINPNRARHYIELGRTYAMAGQPVTARKFLEKGLAMPDKEKDDPEMKVIGREKLAELP
jgi:tetratricopeptide (TPR) repeat protein